MKTVLFALLFIVQYVAAQRHWYDRVNPPRGMRWGRDMRDGCNPPMPRRQYEGWREDGASEWEEQQWDTQSFADQYVDETSYEYDYVYE